MEISRRRFLKLAGGSALGALAVQAGLLRWGPEVLASGRSVSRTTGRFRRAVPSVCLQCPAHCGILGFVEEGFLVKVEGNPLDPNSRGKLCAKGLAGLNHVYNPDRILYPMMRLGARGEGRWRRITWAEAISELSRRLQALREQGRTEELVFVAGLLESASGLVGHFLRSYGTPTVISEMDQYQANRRAGQRLTWGVEGEVSDLSRSRFVLNFGANPYESDPMYLPLMRRLMEAQRRGAHLVTLDPRLSNTAVLSQHWLPVKPGTDAVVALAMAHTILSRGLGHQDFLQRWTNYPVEALAQYLAQYTPEVAEKISGLPASDIESLAVEFATAGPATIITGDGLSQHANGTQNQRAVALLSAITGNVDSPGGYCMPRQFALPGLEPYPAPSVSSPDLSSWLLRFPAQRKISLLLTWMANPAYSSPNPQAVQEVLRDERLVPFLVAMDIYPTETAALADLVLPAATYLESYDLFSPPAYDLVPFVNLMQPVVPPQGESRPFADLCLELAQRLGGDVRRELAFASVEDYLRTAVGGISGLAQGGGWGRLKEQGVWYEEGASPRFRLYERDGFRTPSQRFEVFSSALEQQRQPPLPVYQPSPQPAKASLPLVTFQFNVHTYGRTASCMWLSEIAHANPVWMHPETAQAQGIKTGDRVRLASPTGSVVTKVWVTQAIRPGVLAMGACVGHWASGHVAQAHTFDSDDPNTQLLWWGRHGNGTHPNLLIPASLDPVGAGQAWKDAVVTLTKV